MLNINQQAYVMSPRGHVKPPCRETASTENITPKYEHLFDGTFGEFNM
jgi:hypothetical protein